MRSTSENCAKQTIEPRSACEVLTETSSVLPGWGCCKCSGYNGLQRARCHDCGHERCGDAALVPLQPSDWERLTLLLCAINMACQARPLAHTPASLCVVFREVANLVQCESSLRPLPGITRLPTLTQGTLAEAERLLQRACAMRFYADDKWWRAEPSIKAAFQYLAQMARRE